MEIAANEIGAGLKLGEGRTAGHVCDPYPATKAS